MRGWEKARNLMITKTLRYGPGSSVINENPGMNVETLTAAKTIKQSETGKTFFLGLAGGFTVTLPEVKAGLEYEFIVSVAPTTAYIIVTEGGDDVMVVEVDELTKTVGTEDGVYDDNADTLNFVAATAVVGDRVKMICDGTKWYAQGIVNAIGAVTTSTT